jgi:hypothetical protein
LFTSRDPLGYVDSYDVWMYVGGNPFGLVDPWGMAAEDNPTGGRRGARPRARCVANCPATNRGAEPAPDHGALYDLPTGPRVTWVVNSAAGWGDGLTFGGTRLLRPIVGYAFGDEWDGSSEVDTVSGEYRVNFVVGMGTTIILSGGVAAPAVPISAPVGLIPAAPALPAVPAALAGGPRNVHVYYGVRDGVRVYVGITNDLIRRGAQHAARFNLEPITTSAVTRGEARMIEQALINRNPGFQNLINSISPRHGYFRAAVAWGEAWLQANGHL